MAIKDAAETKTRGEERRLNQVKASPEDVRAHPAPSVFRYRCAREKLARKDANTLRMDSSATVKMRLRKGAAALRSWRPPRSLSRKNIVLRSENKQWTRRALRRAGWEASLVLFLPLLAPSLLLLLLLLTFLAPPTPRSHFLFARQINPPPRRNPPSLTGTSRCARAFLFLLLFSSRLISALSLSLSYSDCR